MTAADLRRQDLEERRANLRIQGRPEMFEPCTDKARLEGCAAPPGHRCPWERGLKCIWGPGPRP